jgi:hypothetical protein
MPQADVGECVAEGAGEGRFLNCFQTFHTAVAKPFRRFYLSQDTLRRPRP